MILRQFMTFVALFSYFEVHMHDLSVFTGAFIGVYHLKVRRSHIPRMNCFNWTVSGVVIWPALILRVCIQKRWCLPYVALKSMCDWSLAYNYLSLFIPRVSIVPEITLYRSSIIQNRLELSLSKPIWIWFNQYVDVYPIYCIMMDIYNISTVIMMSITQQVFFLKQTKTLPAK